MRGLWVFGNLLANARRQRFKAFVHHICAAHSDAHPHVTASKLIAGDTLDFPLEHFRHE